MDIIILKDRVKRKPDIAACEHQRCRPASSADPEGGTGGLEPPWKITTLMVQMLIANFNRSLAPTSER